MLQELLDKCHPLGMFDSISTLAVASNMRELYRLVLVDTPLAPYFAESLTSGANSLMTLMGCPCLLSFLHSTILDGPALAVHTCTS